jgi:predicted transcriptional regulator
VEIIAEILDSCKKPRTKTYIRRQTSVSHAVLHQCILQMLLSRWIELVEEDCGQKKLTITEKGAVFLQKYHELQDISGMGNKRTPLISLPLCNSGRRKASAK